MKLKQSIYMVRHGMRLSIRSLLIALSLIGQCMMHRSTLEAQELADYDYGNLALRGISLGYGNILSNTYEETESYRVNLDLGFLGPGIRMTTKGSYWTSQMLAEEVGNFESSLTTLMLDQGGVVPGNGLDLGPIKV